MSRHTAPPLPEPRETAREFQPTPAATAAAEALMLEHLASQGPERHPYTLYTRRLDSGLPLGVIVFHGCTMGEGIVVTLETLIEAGLDFCPDCERRRQEAAA